MDKSELDNSNMQNGQNSETKSKNDYYISFGEFISFYETMTKYLENRPAIVQNVKLPILYVGDIHGYFSNIIIALKIALKHRIKTIVFLGDYVDRGPYQLKCLIHIMYAYSLNFSKNYSKPAYIDDEFYDLIAEGRFNIIALRGNHETVEMNFLYGFAEHLQKYLIFNSDTETIIEFYYKEFFPDNCDMIRYKEAPPLEREKLKMEFLFSIVSGLYSLLPFISISSKRTVGLHGGIPKPIHNHNYKETFWILKDLKTPIEEPVVLDDYSQKSINRLTFGTEREKRLVVLELLGEIIWNDPIRYSIPRPKPKEVRFSQYIKRKMLLISSIIYRRFHELSRRASHIRESKKNSELNKESECFEKDKESESSKIDKEPESSIKDKKSESSIKDKKSESWERDKAPYYAEKSKRKKKNRPSLVNNLRNTANTELSNSITYDFDKTAFFRKSVRGGSIKNFSRYAFEEFLNSLKFKRLIRSHEAISYELLWDNKFITIFSAYPYMGRVDTSAFFIENKDGTGKIILSDFSIVKKIN